MKKTEQGVILCFIMKEYKSSQTLSPEKCRAQNRLLNDAARKVLSSGFARKMPSDRALASYFRQNHRCGSRDRAFISETVYAMLRYWGFLRLYLPSERRSEIESGSIRLTDRELSALLAAAAFINGDFQAADMLTAVNSMERLPKALNNPTARANQMALYFGCEQKISDNDLLPEWIKDMLPENLDRASFMRLLPLRPPMWIRVQSQDAENIVSELAATGGSVEKHPVLADTYSVRTKTNLFSLESYRSGKFEIQDLASQCVSIIASPLPGERWLDPCAGAGGKTLHLAQLMNRKGSVTAGDIRAHKLDDLRRRARRAGFPNIMTKAHNGGVWKSRHLFDGILVDAPCSCSGVWRRNPGAQWKLCADDIAELASTQEQILNNYAAAVRTGGVLVYATCSLFDAENSAVVRRFLDTHAEYKLDPFVHPLSGKVVPGMVRIDSADGDCDALFIAKMRKVK